MTTKFQVTSKDGKKRLSVAVVSSRSIGVLKHAMELRVHDTESGEAKVLSTKVWSLETDTENEVALAVQKGLMKELSVTFFKLVIRKPDALKALCENRLDDLREMVPFYGYLSEFIGSFSTMFLGTEWVVPPADFTRIATLQSRSVVKGIEIVATQSLSYNPVNHKVVVVKTTFFPSHGTTNFLLKVGRVEVTHSYQPNDWPSIKNYVAEERIQALLHGWLYDVENPSASAAMNTAK